MATQPGHPLCSVHRRHPAVHLQHATTRFASPHISTPMAITPQSTSISRVVCGTTSPASQCSALIGEVAARKAAMLPLKHAHASWNGAVTPAFSP